MKFIVNVKLDVASFSDFESRVQSLLRLADVIKKIDVSGVEPLTNPMDDLHFASFGPREAVVENSVSDILRSGPVGLCNGFFLVPKVV